MSATLLLITYFLLWSISGFCIFFTYFLFIVKIKSIQKESKSKLY